MLLTLLLLLPHGVVWDDFEFCCTPDRSSTKLVATVCHFTNVRVALQPNKDAVSVIRLLAGSEDPDLTGIPRDFVPLPLLSYSRGPASFYHQNFPS